MIAIFRLWLVDIGGGFLHYSQFLMDNGKKMEKNPPRKARGSCGAEEAVQWGPRFVAVHSSNQSSPSWQVPGVPGRAPWLAKLFYN